MEYVIVWSDDHVTVTASGDGNVNKDDEWVQKVIADPRYRPDLRILVDYRLANWSRLPVSEAQRRADLLVRDAARIGHPRVAMIMNRKVDFGVGRMVQSLTVDRTHMEDWRIFEDVDAARTWLQAAN